MRLVAGWEPAYESWLLLGAVGILAVPLMLLRTGLPGSRSPGGTDLRNRRSQ